MTVEDNTQMCYNREESLFDTTQQELSIFRRQSLNIFANSESDYKARAQSKEDY